MENIEAKSVCVLGRQPLLGLAELESLYGGGHVRAVGSNCALSDIEAHDIDFSRLGGTLKVAKVLVLLPFTDWKRISRYIVQAVPMHVARVTGGKLAVGMSVYGIDVKPQAIYKMMRETKESVRGTDHSMRIVPNREAALSTAQVLHNRLTQRGGWELLLIRDGQQTILAQSMFVQDIEAYAARDQRRPKRDAKVGMLPPKLAQIIINLANPKAGSTVLDPFCGTGVILQEALLMDFNVVGTDIDPRMVDYAKENVMWLRGFRREIVRDYQVEIGDAAAYTWPAGINVVASETFLGNPLKSEPTPAELKKLMNEADKLLRAFLRNLHGQLGIGRRISLAVPAWRVGKKLHTLPLIDQLADLGYNRVSFSHVRDDDLVYFRPSQIVARHLVVLQKQ